MLVSKIDLQKLSEASYDAALKDVESQLDVEPGALAKVRRSHKEATASKTVRLYMNNNGLVENTVPQGDRKLNVVERAFWKTDMGEVNEQQARLDMVLESLTQEQADTLDGVIDWIIQEAHCQRDFEDNCR